MMGVSTESWSTLSTSLLSIPEDIGILAKLTYMVKAIKSIFESQRVCKFEITFNDLHSITFGWCSLSSRGYLITWSSPLENTVSSLLDMVKCIQWYRIDCDVDDDEDESCGLQI